MAYPWGLWSPWDFQEEKFYATFRACMFFCREGKMVKNQDQGFIEADPCNVPSSPCLVLSKPSVDGSCHCYTLHHKVILHSFVLPALISALLFW